MAKKVKTKTLPKLKAELQIIFNTFIRRRDEGKPCISCGNYKLLQAGHYYPVQGYDGLRFDENNVHGECSACNCFDESHLIHYTNNLHERIGDINFNKLKREADNYKMNGYKYTRSEIIEKISHYKKELKSN